MVDRLRTTWGVYVGAGLVAIVLYFTALDGPLASTVLYQLLGFGAAAAILVGVRVNRPRVRTPWFVLAASMTLLSIGDLWYSLYDLRWHREAPYPSPSDVPYLLGYVGVAIALVLFSRQRFPGRDVASLLDSLILATSCALLAWVYLMAPYAHDDTLSILQRMVSVLYPAGDVLFIGLAIRLAMAPGRRSTAVLVMLAATITWVVADAVYGVQVLDGTYVGGSSVDAGWLVGYLLWGAVALHPSMKALTRPVPPRPITLSRGRIWALATASLVAPGLLFVQATTDSVREVHVFAGTAAVLFLLVVARLGGVANQLNEAAALDPLTRLPNRAVFMDSLRRAIHDLRGDDATMAVLFIDLDRFKQVNDTLGHAAGDELLRVMADRVRDAVGIRDIAARLGGDEFVVLRPRANLAGAAQLAEVLEGALSEPVQLHGTPFFLSASIGVALVNDPDEDATTVLQHADLAMYRAKQRGKARWEVYDGTTDPVFGRARVERELRDGVAHHELQIWFEPIVRMADASLCGVEALVRWNHPTRGVLSPSSFLDVAEETGLIVPIGQHVLRTACAQAQAWRADHEESFTLFVNLSERQLLQLDLVDVVLDALERSGLPSTQLVLELNEHVVADDFDAASDKLDALRAAGVRIALDDFGTGASSLSSLRHREVDYVKLDRSIAISSVDTPRDRAVMTGLVTIANDAGFQLVAEGIESEDQAVLLMESGIELGQGHLYGRPVPAAEIDALLRDRAARS
jgi:diguanylate cyclase (GGDEF)-like protein